MRLTELIDNPSGFIHMCDSGGSKQQKVNRRQTWSLELATRENISPQKMVVLLARTDYLVTAKKNGNYVAEPRDEFEETPFYVAVMTYLAYFFYIIFGHFRDFLCKHGLEKCKTVKENGNEVRNNFN